MNSWWISLIIYLYTSDDAFARSVWAERAIGLGLTDQWPFWL